MKKYDYLIVGSGLFGATFAYLANKAGKKCLVLEKRNHLGGNVFCEEIKGINVHSYGAHIFHTNNKKIWDFVNSFVPFNRYTNSPVASYKNKLYNLPFNMNTFYQMWKVKTPDEALQYLNEQRKNALNRLNGRQPKNLEEQALILVGKDIYKKLIKGYTEKQWGRKCTDLPPFIIKRLPVRLTFDNNYFNDLYQGIPIGGYNKLIEGLLNGIETKINTDFFKNKEQWESISNKIVYTGKIDEFFNYEFGNLQYRTVYFENEIINSKNYQGNAVINFTDSKIPYTRIIEHKHFEPENKNYENDITIISKEYPVEWKEGMEPFYPINDEKNLSLFNKYKKLEDTKTNTIFGGRLAQYKYFDMDDVIEEAFRIFNNQEVKNDN